jgi:ferredoxin
MADNLLRAEVDADLCIGSGTCAALEPTLFEMGDDGIAYPLQDEADAERLQTAADLCPSGAIKLIGK